MPIAAAVCPWGNVPGSGLGSGLGSGMGGLGGGAAKGVTAALGSNSALAQAAGPSMAMKTAVAGSLAAGSKSVGLGLGIGLGLWGPVILAGASAVGAVYLWQKFYGSRGPTEEEQELAEALAPR